MALKPIVIACAFLFCPALLMQGTAQDKTAGVRLFGKSFSKLERKSLRLRLKVEKVTAFMQKRDSALVSKLIAALANYDSADVMQVTAVQVGHATEYLN